MTKSTKNPTSTHTGTDAPETDDTANLTPYQKKLRKALENVADAMAEEKRRANLPPEERERLVGLLNYWSTSVLESIEPRKRKRRKKQ